MYINAENSFDLLDLKNTQFEQFGNFVKNLIIDNNLDAMNEGQTITHSTLEAVITCERLTKVDDANLITEFRLLRASSIAAHTLGRAEDIVAELITEIDPITQEVTSRKLFIENEKQSNLHASAQSFLSH